MQNKRAIVDLKHFPKKKLSNEKNDTDAKYFDYSMSLNNKESVTLYSSDLKKKMACQLS